VVAYADLGGLGNRQGPPISCDWVRPSLIPEFLPWLLILALLLLKPNRCAAAWWIFAPLGLLTVATSLPTLLLGRVLPVQFERFAEWLLTLGFGVAAVWLLSGYLAWRNRLLSLVAVAALSAAACVVTQHGTGVEFIFFPGMFVLGLSVTLTLAGFACRRKYGWLRVTLWVMAAVWLYWAVWVGSIVFRRGDCPLTTFLSIVGTEAGLTFAALLPFLMLSFLNPLYRERLKGLLHLGQREAPQVIDPTPPLIANEA
jgi:hypothetical protein